MVVVWRVCLRRGSGDGKAQQSRVRRLGHEQTEGKWHAGGGGVQPQYTQTRVQHMRATQAHTHTHTALPLLISITQLLTLSCGPLSTTLPVPLPLMAALSPSSTDKKFSAVTSAPR